jgi:DNA repair protein RecO (recombination protein O)
LRDSYPRISAGYAVVEAMDAIPSDGVPDEEIFDLLIRVLKTLDDPTYDPTLVPASFFLRLLALDGSAPLVEECVNCGKGSPLVAFDAQIGGTLCDDCRQGVAISNHALLLLRRVLGGDLAGVLREVNPLGSGEVMALAQEAIEQHFGRRLRAPGAAAPLSALPARDE